jgi:hypothetical protein
LPPADWCLFRGRKDRLARPTSLFLDLTQQSFRNSPTAYHWPRVQPFNFGVLVEHRDAATAHHHAVEPRHEKAYVRLEQLLNRKAVPLMRLVGCTTRR